MVASHFEVAMLRTRKGDSRKGRFFIVMLRPKLRQGGGTYIIDFAKITRSPQVPIRTHVCYFPSSCAGRQPFRGRYVAHTSSQLLPSVGINAI